MPDEPKLGTAHEPFGELIATRVGDQHNPDLFYREFAIEERVANESREVNISFSSEAPVRRWFGNEVLLHGERNVNLTRLRSMGSVLLNHNPDRIVGSIVDSRVEDKKGRARIRLDDDPIGEYTRKKVNSGSLRGVSVGYRINSIVEVDDGATYEGVRGPAHVATDWEPIEISLTPVPADSTVGVGRALTRSLDGITIERKQAQEPIKEDQPMPEEPKDKEVSQEELRKLVTEKLKEYQPLLARAKSISESYPGAYEKAVTLATEGRSLQEIQTELLAIVSNGRGPATPPTEPKDEDPKAGARKELEAMSSRDFAESLGNLALII